MTVRSERRSGDAPAWPWRSRLLPGPRETPAAAVRGLIQGGGTRGELIRDFVDAADLVVVPHDLLKGLRGRQTTNRVADRPGDEQEHDRRAGQQDHKQKALETTLEQHREPKRAA